MSPGRPVALIETLHVQLYKNTYLLISLLSRSEPELPCVVEELVSGEKDENKQIN